MERVTIVDYGMGNVAAIANMIRKVGGHAEVSSKPDELVSAKRLILPGVGAFDTGVAHLRERGLESVLRHKARVEKVPVLGICLGMQILTLRSEEGRLPGLGWIDGETRRFQVDPGAEPLHVPHMGWNDVRVERPNPLLRGSEGPWSFYFAHSYHVSCARSEEVIATTTYRAPFVSGVMKENVFGLQFHPEKSHVHGMRLLRRFLEL